MSLALKNMPPISCTAAVGPRIKRLALSSAKRAVEPPTADDRQKRFFDQPNTRKRAKPTCREQSMRAVPAMRERDDKQLERKAARVGDAPDQQAIVDVPHADEDKDRQQQQRLAPIAAERHVEIAHDPDVEAGVPRAPEARERRLRELMRKKNRRDATRQK